MASKRDLYLAFGQTADIAQAFECELGSALLWHELGHAGLIEEQDPARAQQIFEQINAQTLGSLLKSVRKKIPISLEDEELFQEGVRLRNRLMHGFFLRNYPRYLTAEGCTDIVNTLDAMWKRLEAARSRAAAMTAALAALHNVRSGTQH